MFNPFAQRFTQGAIQPRNPMLCYLGSAWGVTHGRDFVQPNYTGMIPAASDRLRQRSCAAAARSLAYTQATRCQPPKVPRVHDL